MTATPTFPVDRDRAVALLRRAIGCASVTGAEAGFAAMLADALRESGVGAVTTSDFLPGRPNVRGIRKGTGGGRRLLLVGHTDVVHVRGWRERWSGTEREDPFGAAIVDGEIWGRGAADLKAGICTAIEALRVLDDAGIVLAGDVEFAFIGDEESGEPGTGVSAGMKALAPLIEAGDFPRPDFAVYVEPTTLDVYAAQIGFFIAEIAVTGRTSYFGVPELGADALKASHAILSALWDHSADLESRGDHPLVGKSFLLVTAIEGGGLVAVPERCRLSLIRKLRPGEDLTTARDEIEAVVRGAIEDPDIHVAFAYPAGRDHAIGGTAMETDPASEGVTMLADAIRAVRPDRGRIAGAPYWSEAPFLDALGIPAVYFAPGDIRICHSLEERVSIEEYLDGIAALAAFAARYCGVANQGEVPNEEREESQ
ncbi:M20 family metallopeptidase [Bauldia litoralis]|uniref:Acetylornithine deacetylase n=1 Tax=Bauldia litoralis TaxID=665467 RepID=A0A1G6EMH7_9HYPH|nr:M20/M25/M40 family metallo-hydrolase [Bauldia litoralis]SDB58085.1 acetylornithine deacetylase [Bauldia litoralis]